MASVNEPDLRKWIQSLVEPSVILTWAMSHYVKVCFETVFKRGQVLAPFLQSSKVRDEAFGRFWVEFTANRIMPESPNTSTTTDTCTSTSTTSPPPQIQQSSDLIPPLLTTASGIVLDIGPGTGSQLPLLHSPRITAIYGPEPCLPLHTELASRIRAEGLEEKYTILPCSVDADALLPVLKKHSLIREGVSSIEDVEGGGGGGGVFDTIICVRVLCSVPNLEKTVSELYTLLKPGGSILITEHVVNPWRTAKGSIVARVMQALYQLCGWSWVVGDCRLDRDTETALKRAADRDGGWEMVELERWFGRTPMPYIAGRLVKRSKGIGGKT